MIFNHFHLRKSVSLAFLGALSLLAVACEGSSGGQASPEFLATAVRNPEQSLSVHIMARDVEVGERRLPVVVFMSDADQTRLDDRLQELSFAYRQIDDEEFEPLPGMKWRAWPARGGAYTAEPDFDRAGVWEVQVTLRESSGDRVGSAFLEVQQDSAAPGTGDNAPVTVTKTASTIEEVRQISSALEPDLRFYRISLDKALASGDPTVILFSTPAFCQTQTCGPQLATLGELADRHGDSMNFIHVEIFDNIREMLDTGDASIGEVAAPVTDWGLITEPWTFFIDEEGVIESRFEQFATLEELEEAADSLLAAG